MSNLGIAAYGAYVPKYRLRTSDIAITWKKRTADIEKSLLVTEKSVAAADEDAVTMAYEAASIALAQAHLDPSQIDICFVGSESHPYAVNPTSTIVAEFLGIGNNYTASDLEFACKAGTTAMIAASSMIKSGYASFGLVIGSDAAQAKPHDILEYTAASAACAYIISNSKANIAEIMDFTSYSSDTPDFWRRDGVRFPSHGGRFTGEPAYFAHVEGAAKRLMAKIKLKPADFKYCIFHMPNGKFPRQVAKRLGFTPDQLAPSLTIDLVGNPYTASSLLGLAAVLDIAKPGERIFMVSYGSGAGSDAFSIQATKNISAKKNIPVSSICQEKEYISYLDYLRFGGKI